MGIAKKGSRTIVVEDSSYRWVVSPDDGYMVLVIENLVTPGQRLHAYFEYHDVFESERRKSAEFHLITGQRRSITPKVVRTVLLEGLRRGWTPSLGNLPPFKMQDADQLVPLHKEIAESSSANDH